MKCKFVCHYVLRVDADALAVVDSVRAGGAGWRCWLAVLAGGAGWRYGRGAHSAPLQNANLPLVHLIFHTPPMNE